MAGTVTIVEHPLVQHKLTLMRDKRTTTALFRALLREVGMLLACEALRDLPLTKVAVETPLATMQSPVIAGKKLCLVSIMRAGNGLLDGVLDIVPSARVGHVGLYRDEATLEPVEYYFKVPDAIEQRLVVVIDPMLATGRTATAAISRLKGAGARSVRLLCLLAAPEGIAHLTGQHPDVPVFTAAVDSHLNERAYIVPGLGDAGDRLYGTG